MKLTLLALLLGSLGVAQTTTPVQLAWTAPAFTLTVGGSSSAITYNAYKLPGQCPASVSKPYPTPLASGLTATAYSDTTAPAVSCYFVTAVVGGSESGPSNLYQYVPPPTGLTAH